MSATQQTQVIAHRGARGLVAHGNTMASFEKAVEVGAPMMEFDVRRTRDHQLVCFHDPDIGGRPLCELTLRELRDAAAKEDFEVPRLADVLEHFSGRILFDIEVKEVGYETQIMDLVSGLLQPSQYIIKSFEDVVVGRIKALEPACRAGLLLGLDNPKNVVKTRASELFPALRLARCMADFVSPNHKLVRLGFVKRMQALGQDVYVWTVNEPELMREMVARGVHALITDRPDLALKVVAET